MPATATKTAGKKQQQGSARKSAAAKAQPRKRAKASPKPRVAKTAQKPKRKGSAKTTAGNAPGKAGQQSKAAGRRTPRAPKPKGMEASYSGRIFRSRLEARWAILLDLLDINWDYEPCHYQVGPELYYLPDFYLPDQRMWLEVKGPAFLDAGSMAKCLAAVAGPSPLPLREAPYTPSTSLLLAGPFTRTAGRPLHTLITRASEGRASLGNATLGPEGVTACGAFWDEVDATGIKKARRPAPARVRSLLEPAPAPQAMDPSTAAAYRFAAKAAFDDTTLKLLPGNDRSIVAALERRRAGRPLGAAA